ncbi:MFS general substrate transporter [Agrocybe pediades]|nr:MFS general substrate transporter [Agrocybe pediades]
MDNTLQTVRRSSTTSATEPALGRHDPDHDTQYLPGSGQELSTSRSGSAPLEVSLDYYDLPAVDKGQDAWIFCISACAFEVFIWGWNNTYGIFQEYYSTHPPFDQASIGSLSTIGTASLGIQYIGLLFFVLAFQRYPEYAKPAMWTTWALSVGVLVLSSFSNKVWQMITLQGVLFGVSAGILYSPVMIWLPEWFVEKRGLAAGLIFGGSGAGGFIFPLVMGALLDKVGFRWTLRIWSIVFGICCAAAILGLKPRVPIRKPTLDIPRPPLFPKDLYFLKSPVLLGVVGITLIQALAFFPVSVFISTYTSSITTATFPSRMVLALFNAASAVFFIIFGRLCDLYPFPYVIMASGLGCAISVFVLWGFASSLPWIFVFSAVFGGLGGAFPGIWPAAATEVGGTRDHITSIVFGCFAVVQGVTSIIGPIIAALFHDAAKNHEKTKYGSYGYRKVEIFIGSMGVGTFVGGVVLLFYSTAKRKVKN